MSKYGEPWCNRETRVYMGATVAFSGGGFDIRNCPDAETRAARIVQCVNACAGIADPKAAMDAAREALKGI